MRAGEDDRVDLVCALCIEEWCLGGGISAGRHILAAGVGLGEFHELQTAMQDDAPAGGELLDQLRGIGAPDGAGGGEEADGAGLGELRRA